MFHEVNDMLARILTAAAECMKTTECNHYVMYTCTVLYVQKLMALEQRPFTDIKSYYERRLSKLSELWLD